ncbi:MAG: UDP binding domain-containing protein, partial [Acidimicrobiales bacterium]
EAERLGPLVETGCVVINKSTLPVGSTREVERSLGRGDVSVVSNPEFLREGSAVHDCLNPDRIVIGADDAAAASRVAALYERIRAPLLVTDPASAELIKYASNAFLATKISYINAIANLCEVTGADVKEVVLGMGYDKRIGFEFLRPGPGWGGSCFHPDETILVRRGDVVRLLTFEALFAEVERIGTEGWEALSWDPAGVGPEFHRIAAFTSRSIRGSLIELRTKMGRRIRVTPDHPIVVSDGRAFMDVQCKPAGEVTTGDWMPVSVGAPDLGWEEGWATPLTTLDQAGLTPGEVIVRCGADLCHRLPHLSESLPSARRRDVVRCGALRLDELTACGVSLDDPFVGSSALLGTTTNGTYIPAAIALDEDFWRMIGLYLAEGSISTDGARKRISWHFHPSDEAELVAFVVDYWQRMNVKTSTFHPATSTIVKVSSRILAGWLEHGLGVGRTCYDKAIPDVIWDRPDGEKMALLRGLWDGDGSWSRVAGGPSVVFEYGTVSRSLADGMLRLLGALGITARLKVGRTARSTCDTYWLIIAGADQLCECLWLFPPDEQQEIGASISQQARRIAPTGYRSSKNASWVRVVSAEKTSYVGNVYSVEVPATGTVVSTFGVVVHNCFPKDTRALVRIAEDAGYEFGLLEGVIAVNLEQHDRMASKIAAHCPGGVLKGASVAVWGLTFKALTDDVRDSPALEVIRRLRAQGAEIRAYDPMVPPERAASIPALAGVTVCPDAYAACAGADVAVVLTEWDEFRWLDFAKVLDVLAHPTIVDARNLLDPAPLRRRGFTYTGVGRR